MMKRFFRKYREPIVYVIVGLMTTAVSYGVRLIVLYSLSARLSVDLASTDAEMLTRSSALRGLAGTLGWVAGVLFAFFPNKFWVFREENRSAKHTLRQFGAFVISRVGTYFAELGLAVLLPMLLGAVGYRSFTLLVEFDADKLTLVISAVVITVLNYLISKLLVFRKQKTAPEEHTETTAPETFGNEPDDSANQSPSA